MGFEYRRSRAEVLGWLKRYVVVEPMAIVAAAVLNSRQLAYLHVRGSSLAPHVVCYTFTLSLTWCCDGSCCRVVSGHVLPFGPPRHVHGEPLIAAPG